MRRFPAPLSVARMTEAQRSFLVCASQRSGSTLL
ncbi:sulfotransferase, partial [Xanthomonas vasicola pv. vasculorum]